MTGNLDRLHRVDDIVVSIRSHFSWWRHRASWKGTGGCWMWRFAGSNIVESVDDDDFADDTFDNRQLFTFRSFQFRYFENKPIQCVCAKPLIETKPREKKIPSKLNGIVVGNELSVFASKCEWERNHHFENENTETNSMELSITQNNINITHRKELRIEWWIQVSLWNGEWS